MPDHRRRIERASLLYAYEYAPGAATAEKTPSRRCRICMVAYGCECAFSVHPLTCSVYHKIYTRIPVGQRRHVADDVYSTQNKLNSFCGSLRIQILLWSRLWAQVTSPVAAGVGYGADCVDRGKTPPLRVGPFLLALAE